MEVEGECFMRKLGLTVVVMLVAMLVLGGTALAATPQDIYDDYEDNGILDGTYTQAELEAYQADATVHQYGNADTLDSLDELAGVVAGAMNEGKTFEEALAAATGEGEGEDRGVFPFTGWEMLLGLLAAVALIGSGIVLRRTARYPPGSTLKALVLTCISKRIELPWSPGGGDHGRGDGRAQSYAGILDQGHDHRATSGLAGPHHLGPRSGTDQTGGGRGALHPPGHGEQVAHADCHERYRGPRRRPALRQTAHLHRRGGTPGALPTGRGPASRVCPVERAAPSPGSHRRLRDAGLAHPAPPRDLARAPLSLIHISEPTRLRRISY